MEENKIVIELDEEGPETGEEKKPKVRVLSFLLGSESYCAMIKDVKEVVRMFSYTRVPNTPDFITGVMNVRGEIISVIDLRHFFGLRASDHKEEPMIIISDVSGKKVGLLVDKVEESCEIGEEMIQPPLDTISSEMAQYTIGHVQLEKGVMAVIDLKKVLNSSEIERLRKPEN